jgi:type IV secretion system protein VirB10
MFNSRRTTGLAAILIISTSSFAADDAITLPAGTELHVQLITSLSSKTNETGDMWSGKVVEPVFAKGKEIVPQGSSVDGHITYVKGPGRTKGKGEMRLVVDSISTSDASRYNIVASLKDAEGANVADKEGTMQGPGKDKTRTEVETGVGAAAGAGVGAIAHGGTGALYGAGIGAMAGLVHSALKKGKDIVVPAGSEMTFVIPRDTTMQRTEGSRQ